MTTPGDGFSAKTRMKALMSQAEGWLTALLEARTGTAEPGSRTVPTDAAAETPQPTPIVSPATAVQVAEATPPRAAPDSSVRVQLPEILDIKAAVPLARQLLALRGQPVTIEAAGVQRLGGLCLQVLLSAMETWRRDGVELSFARPSSSFAEYAELLGAAPLFSQHMKEQAP